MGMTIYQFRASLRTDLKDSGSLWSDAELDRSVERAVQDLSRFLPLEKIYETTLDLDVDDESVTSPAATSATAIVNAKDISASVSGDTCTLVTKNWSPARTVKLTITDASASITNFTVIVKGIDQNGYYQEESFYYRGGLVQTGVKLFAHITEVEIDQITGSGASDVLSIGTGVHTAIPIRLTNKPVKPDSVTVTSSPAGTTFTLDTDYTVDYLNGTISLISGGTMAAATAYLVSYTKSDLVVDVSGLSGLSRISRVEYPADQVPQQFASFGVYGDYMYIGSKKSNQSQERMVDGEHIAIYYETPHKPPSTVSPGSYPENLDEVVSIGAAAYALFTKSNQYEHQAVIDLASLRTELGLTTAVHVLAAAALAKIATHVTEADAALDKVNTYLINNTNEDSKYWLTKITTDITSLRTAIGTAVDAANAYLDEVDTTDFAGSGNDGAEVTLKAGEDKIDAVNIGAQVGQLYAQYSQAWQGIATARTNAALGFVQEATLRLNNLRSYIEQSAGWGQIAQTFAAEAIQRLGMAASYYNEASAEIDEIRTYLEEARLYAEAVSGDLVLSDRFKAEALERINEFYAILKSRQEYHKHAASVAVQQYA